MVGPGTEAAAPDARPRLVALGASNLALGLPTVVATAQSVFGEPLDILATPGHGRSYGMTTSLLGRQLPGILSCGLWDELARRPGAPTAALITDIGNDLIYDASVEQIVTWLEMCLTRLRSAGARVVMTRLPMASLRRIPPHRYRLLRRLFYPRGRLPQDVMLARAEELNHQIEVLGREHGSALVELPGQWYGVDPIHVRRRLRGVLWRATMAPLVAGAAFASRSLGWRMSLALRFLVPQERVMWGRVQRCAQPAARLADGTSVALY